MAAGTVIMNPHDAAINTLVDSEGCILSQIQSDGLGSLLGQSRANHGVKKGRYYYEVSVLGEAQLCVFRVGFSTLGAKFVGAENSVAFTNLYRFRTGGELSPATKGVPAFQKNDVIGVLLNLDPKASNKNTISLFVNGKRASEPKPLPDSMLKETLYPHVAFRGCSLGVHFDHQQKELPFTVNMLGHGTALELEKSKIGLVANPKAVFPVGLDTDAFVQDFTAKNVDYLELTPQYFSLWCKESAVNKKAENFFGVQCFDNTQLLAQWLRLRPRNAIVALGCTLFPKERAIKLQLVPTHAKECIVLPIKTAGPTEKVYANYADVTLPTDEEGYTTITYQTSHEAEEANLELWKKDQKLRSRVEGLKAGSWFNERLAEWTKFVTEKKTTDEGKLFADEDWMLAKVRIEIVHLVQAFKEDVNDEERPSFPPALTDAYYKTYTNKSFNPMTFACGTVEALITEHISDCVSIDGKGLLTATLDKDVALEKIFELVNIARERRETRVGSGDEMFDLKFSASNPGGARGAKGALKGKGPKRPLPFGAPVAQRQRVA
eukprot:GEMP01021831.1.p1 GENE.GEMP01021831.1~~GEMP01021831.1.p1  ORF type:complete len:595 (+),score=166.30 GEMP01021831.1:139-1785(+)